MTVVPVAQDAVGRLAGERRLGAYFGVLASGGGLAVLGGSALLGSLLEAQGPPALPWAVTAALPLASAVVWASSCAVSPPCSPTRPDLRREELTVTRRLAVILAVLGLALTGCFSGSGGGDPAGGRLRVGLAFPPTSGLSPYGNEATLATRLGVTEPLVVLEGGTPTPALATAWTQSRPRSGASPCVPASPSTTAHR